MTNILFLVMYSQFGDGNPFCDRYPIFGDIDPLLVINILFFKKTVMYKQVCGVNPIFVDVCPYINICEHLYLLLTSNQ